MFLSMKRDLKKICKEQQTKFWEKRNDELKGSKGEKFWNIWKSCDENIRNKSPNFCDGSKWESFYSKLFKDPNSNNKSILLTYQSKRKYQKKNSSFLNKLTNCQELKKIIKLLKNGKSPGIDRISNEMIKHSFEILKNCFVKLFNLIICARYVPNEWCKGLITPLHKSRDPSNLDNFRPICVLSCLCKFFTNLLNSRLYQVCKIEN